MLCIFSIVSTFSVYTNRTNHPLHTVESLFTKMGISSKSNPLTRSEFSRVRAILPNQFHMS